jgi:CBS domain-containing protein
MIARESMTADPVMVDDLASRQLVGVITDGDIVVRSVALGHGPTAKVSEHMSRAPLVSATELSDLSEIVELMRRYRVRRLPVLDAHGAVVGVVAQADVAIEVGPNDPLLVEQLVEGISRRGAPVTRD